MLHFDRSWGTACHGLITLFKNHRDYGCYRMVLIYHMVKLFVDICNSECLLGLFDAFLSV